MQIREQLTGIHISSNDPPSSFTHDIIFNRPIPKSRYSLFSRMREILVILRSRVYGEGLPSGQRHAAAAPSRGRHLQFLL